MARGNKSRTLEYTLIYGVGAKTNDNYPKLEPSSQVTLDPGLE